jgi:hypothetical protein
MNPLPVLEEVNESNEQVECLRAQGFPSALARALSLQSTRAFPLRLWIVDNSGSMREPDGRRLVESSTKDNVKWAKTTRWEELKDTVTYHAQLAGLLQAPTEFMLLNPPANNGLHQMSVAEMGPDMIDEDLYSLKSALASTSPGGCTPLTRHVNSICALVSSMQRDLETNGQRVVVVLATDGIPTDPSGHAGWKVDQDFEQALQRLQGLPVWIVVRLCTNDERVVEYYQKLDDRLEWNLEVLDDFVGEAKEVHQYNPWLNYSLPLHRCREWGFPSRLFDLLDEKTFSLDEMREFLQLVFADSKTCLPDPAADWEEFEKCVSKLIDKEEKPWNPIKRKPTPWIDLRQLENTYGPYRHQRKFITMVTTTFVVICVLWQLITKMVHSLWQNASLSPTPSPTPLPDTTVLSSTNGLLWILGGFVIMLLYLPRGPPNMKLVLAIVGVMLSLSLPSLLTKTASFWKGAGWILGGSVALFGVAAFNDR